VTSPCGGFKNLKTVTVYMILFLFGRPGAGKTLVGEKLAESLEAMYFDCDDCYTDRDISAILGNTFTDEDSDLFLGRVIQVLKDYQETELLVASQSLFREEQRERLIYMTEFEAQNVLAECSKIFVC
jgi:gluconate kinase